LVKIIILSRDIKRGFPSTNDDWTDRTPFLYRLDGRNHYPLIKMTSKKYISGSAPSNGSLHECIAPGSLTSWDAHTKRIFTHPLILLSHLLILSSFFVILLCDGCHGCWNVVNDDDLLCAEVKWFAF
jgi:hypothetical protein